MLVIQMTERERFLAVLHFEKPDYGPLINAQGLGYVHNGGLLKLHREGLPEWVDDIETWLKYWGQCGFEQGSSLGRDAPGIKKETWIEGEFEFVRGVVFVIRLNPVPRLPSPIPDRVIIPRKGVDRGAASVLPCL